MRSFNQIWNNAQRVLYQLLIKHIDLTDSQMCRLGLFGCTECFKKSFTLVFQMLLCGECYGNIYT
jgi:protein-arginine kinase activator protein McsA